MVAMGVMIPNGLEAVLSIDPEVMHGELCFAGTRVPLSVLLDNLEEGMGLNEFLTEYPTVQRSQAEAVIAVEQGMMRQAAGLGVGS
jgi:uncharacterized protein (DUF433 family)